MQVGNVQSGSLKLDFAPTKAANALRFDSYDPRDRNQNGVVSAVEERAYALRHPEVEARKRLRTADGGGTQRSLEAPAAPRTSLAYHDPADTNQDGVVSAVEDQAYALKHPELELRKSLNAPAPASTYSQTGARAEKAAGGSLDFFA